MILKVWRRFVIVRRGETLRGCPPNSLSSDCFLGVLGFWSRISGPNDFERLEAFCHCLTGWDTYCEIVLHRVKSLVAYMQTNNKKYYNNMNMKRGISFIISNFWDFTYKRNFKIDICTREFYMTLLASPPDISITSITANYCTSNHMYTTLIRCSCQINFPS